MIVFMRVAGPALVVLLSLSYAAGAQAADDDDHLEADASSAGEIESDIDVGDVSGWKANMILDAAQLEQLSAVGWRERVGESRAIWVSVDEQRVRIIERKVVLFDVPCATSSKGVGSMMDSLKTPLGWHTIKTKVGEGRPWGQVYRSRRPTKEIWKRGGETKEDLVLTRVLVLDGLEEGRNKGGNVDSYLRNIYIHGTNDEASVGTPSSHGCVRLTNDDILEAFSLIEQGALVLITAAGHPTDTE